MNDFSDLIIIPGSTPDTEHYPENHDSPPTGQIQFFKTPAATIQDQNFSYDSTKLASKIGYEIKIINEIKPTEVLQPNINFENVPTSSVQADFGEQKPRPNEPEISEKTLDSSSTSRKIQKPRNEPENFSANPSTAHEVLQFVDLHEDNFISQNENLQAHLVNKDLWDKFSNVNTEMIVTKSGRRIFPQLSFEISGFIPNDKYSVYVYFKPTDQNTWKFSGGAWKVVGKNQPLPRGKISC